MQLKGLLSTALLAGLASAQTPAGFEPKVEQKLEVIFGTKAVATPGMAFTRAETARIPTIGFKSALNATYLYMMIDLDVPASFTNPSAGPRRTNLHAMVSGFKAAATATSDGVFVLTSTATTPKAYVGPGPPPENPPYAHRYVSLIYEQPAGFAVPASETAQVRAGIGFDLKKFAAAAGLTLPIAANYMNVTGGQ